MNKKGEMGAGMIIFLAVTLIVGVLLFQVVAQQVGSSTNTVAVANESLGVIVNGTSIYLTEYRSISDVVIYNASGNVIIGAGNYTVTNNALDTNNALAVEVVGSASTDFNTWNISGTAQPVTYVADAGARSVAALIAIFFALALVAVAISPVARESLFGMGK